MNMRVVEDKRMLQFTHRVSQAGFKLFIDCLLKWYCPLTLENSECLQVSGPFIICSNHCSHLDAAIVIKSIETQSRKLALLAAKDYFFDNKIRRHLLSRCMNLIALDRQARISSTRATIQRCQFFFEQTGGCILIYPEGTRSVSGKLQPFKKGAAYMALKLNVPVVPAFISGSYQAMPKGRNTVFRNPCHIKFGSAIYLNNDHLQSEASIGIKTDQLTELLFQKIQALGGDCDESS